MSWRGLLPDSMHNFKALKATRMATRRSAAELTEVVVGVEAGGGGDGDVSGCCADAGG